MSKTILVVDDSRTVRSMLSFSLKNAGYNIMEAENGIDALEKLYASPGVDCFIIDINMPKMDGITLIRTLREQAAYSDIPIIVLSTEREERDKEEAQKAGANLYIVKPPVPEELIKNIKMLLKD